MAAHTTPPDSTVDLAQVEGFFAEQLQLPRQEQLPESELVKVKDLCEDVMELGPSADAGEVDKPTCLGRLFACFERAAGEPLPHLLRRGMLWIRRPFREHSPPATVRWECHAVPSGADSAPLQCATAFHVFDRLSQIHGGNFRGSVVVNCTLGVVASTALLFSLTPPYGMQWMIDRFHDNVVNLPMAAIVEFLCLGSVALIYLRGRTPEQDDEEDDPEPPTMKRHWSGQRWHQRWLEYRLVAERFRYVDLVLPLGVDATRGLSIAPQRDASRMWHQRYFEATTARARPLRQTVRQYRDHALAVMAAQEAYHVRNHHRRGAIAHRLHNIAKWAFYVGISICLWDIGLALFGKEHSATAAELSCIAPDNLKATLLFWAALLPIFSAATYAILTHAEYAKVADASGETFERIHRIYDDLSAIPATDDLADERTLVAMRPDVIEFVTMAITEATGWRAMLRDKNVPLL